MFKPFQTAAVLGAGVMGTQIAAHLANAGMTVYLLDIPAKNENKNKLVETAFKKAQKQSPPIFFTDKTARRITLGNFDEHFDYLANVDWVIEAVIENLTIKQQLMTRVENTIRDDTIVSTNTSGLPIHMIAEGRSESFRERFLGTHFFNPPRYLKLLELIPTPDTSAEVLARMEWFASLYLGKGVVIAKDTPNFIGNRIGMYAMMLAIKALTDSGGYTIEEIDTLTGTIVGRPKSATFRTADLVGLDTLVYVAENLYPAIPQDENRHIFRVPPLLNKLVETGTLGAKTGQGFYKKQGKEILSINPVTLVYESAKPMNLGDIKAIAKIPDLGQRLRTLYQDQSRAGKFFQQFILKVLAYSAHRIPEIADNPADIDKAMRWGFGWELGPFEIWDVLGLETVIADMKAHGISVPDWVNSLEKDGWGYSSQKKDEWGDVSENIPPNSSQKKDEWGDVSENIPPNSSQKKDEWGYSFHKIDEINLTVIKSDPKRILWENSEAALLDLGDKVALYEFRSKGNTLSLKVIEGFAQILDMIEKGDFRGLVIGNEGVNFSAGANLAEMGMLAKSGSMEPIVNLIVTYQSLLQRIHYFPKPIVAAIHGRALAGGCELVMACPHIVAAAETYIGLVELAVGLIPGAGGIMRMAKWAANRAATESSHHIQPFLMQGFETIGMAKVSRSAYEAQELGFLPANAKIVMNADNRLYIAKQEVICLDKIGYIPPHRNPIMVLGRPARAILEHAAYIMQQGGYITEYDRYLANRLAYVITGGELSAPSLVDEDYLLELEREMFTPLLQKAETQQRIAHMLKTKKPLRN